MGLARHRGAGPYRAFGKAAQRDHPVIHHQRAGHSDIDAELGRNFDHLIAAGQDSGRQVALLRAEYIGGLGRVPEAGQVVGIGQELDPDQPAAARQGQRRRAVIFIERDRKSVV